jgi:UDP-2,4-diacetamido-2,4,6-trideoxy-beta-L-altropyranose hydrolase
LPAAAVGMTKIIIRCDASISIGSGHVIRCRTLARELKRRGAEVSFLCRRQPGDLIALLERDFPVIALPEQPLAPCDGLKGRDLYGAWLGCTQEQDAAQCLDALAQVGIKSASWLVTDHYGLDTIWETHLLAGLTNGSGVPKLFVIDDLADRSHQADLLLDQNYYGNFTDQRYQSLLSTRCCQLLGPSYALLGPEYGQLHSLIPQRTELRRILVFFGGVDHLNLTSQAIEALQEPDLEHLAVDIVLGQQSSQWHAVAKLVASRPGTSLHPHLPSLAGLISRADLFIGACGATTWERFCLGCPAITMAIAENQYELSQSLRRDNLAYVINCSCIDYRSAFVEAITHLSATQNYAKLIKSLPKFCTGNGVNVIASKLLDQL